MIFEVKFESSHERPRGLLAEVVIHGLKHELVSRIKGASHTRKLVERAVCEQVENGGFGQAFTGRAVVPDAWGLGRWWSVVGGQVVGGFPPFPLLVRPLSGRYHGAIGKLEARRWQIASTA